MVLKLIPCNILTVLEKKENTNILLKKFTFYTCDKKKPRTNAVCIRSILNLHANFVNKGLFQFQEKYRKQCSSEK